MVKGRKGMSLEIYPDAELIAAIDEWRKRQPGSPPSRAKAARVLIKRALNVEEIAAGKKKDE
jgi:hypothetical protein